MASLIELLPALTALASAMGVGKLLYDGWSRRNALRDAERDAERVTRDKLFETSVKAARLEAENTFLKQQLSDCLASRP